MRCVLRIEGRAAHELLLGEPGVPGAVCAGPGEFGLDGGKLGLRGLRLQAQVAGIELGEQVAALDRIAGVHEAPGDVAAHAERQRALFAGADLTGISADRVIVAARGLGHEHRSRFLLRYFLLAARGQDDHEGRHGQGRWGVAAPSGPGRAQLL